MKVHTRLGHRTKRPAINGKGVGIRVFQFGVPCIFNNPSSDPRVLKHIFQAYPTRNLITFPLEYGSRRIGVLHAANKKNSDFTQADLDLLGLASKDDCKEKLENICLELETKYP